MNTVAWCRTIACLTAFVLAASSLQAEDKTKVQKKPAQGEGWLGALFGISNGNADAADNKANSAATHERLKAVKVKGKNVTGTLQTLCADEKGQVLCVVGGGRYGGLSDKSSQKSEVQVFDSDGKFVTSWVVDFKASAICVGAKGDVFVAGDGQVACFKPNGQLVKQTEAPHIAKLMADKGKLRTLAEQRKKQTVDSYSNMLKQFEKQTSNLKKANGNDANSAGYAQMIKTYKQILEQAEKKSIDDYMMEIGGQVKSVNAVAASANELFLTTGEAKGYGYSVWRMSLELSDAKQIKEGLSGCCGQMDVQCCDDGIVVAENTRHRVAVYDRNGKPQRSFGRRDREGEGEGFGGCCNPMNTRPCANGDILTAESEGFIKRFDSTGKFVGLVAHAPLSGGCKNVAVAATKDLRRVFFCDVPGSQVLILAQKSDKPAVASRSN